jgi:flagellar protein FliJ
MKRYHFRLEKLLSLKKYNEKEWEIRLAQAAGECIRIENRIEQNLFEKARTMQECRFTGPLQLNELLTSEFYIRRLGQETVQLEEELVEKEGERESVRKEYLEASKKRKVLDKLKERQEGEFYRKQLREEVKGMDDISNAMYIRKQES